MIPRAIHQVLLFDDLTADLRALSETFKEKNPSFVYTLWTINNLPFSAMNWKLTEILSWPLVPLVIKADLVRYEITRLFKGWYADIDCRNVRGLAPLVDLLTKEDFICGLESAEHIGNAFFGVGQFCDIMEEISDESIDLVYNNKKEKYSFNDIMALSGVYRFDAMVRARNIKPFPQDYFAPINWKGEGTITENTFVNHLYHGVKAGGWAAPFQPKNL